MSFDKGLPQCYKAPMTKREMARYARRRAKIFMLMDTHAQAEIARLLGMTRQRVYQIINAKPARARGR